MQHNETLQAIADFIGDGEALVTKSSDWDRMREVIREYPEVREKLIDLDIRNLPIRIDRAPFVEDF